LATLAEGDKEGKLSEVLSTMISKADASQLPGLKTLYIERAEAKFTKTCKKCGSTEFANRSSVEAADIVTAEAKPIEDYSYL